MKTIEKLAIKYLLVGLGIEIIGYSVNVIFGTFILFDSLKLTKNNMRI